MNVFKTVLAAALLTSLLSACGTNGNNDMQSATSSPDVSAAPTSTATADQNTNNAGNAAGNAVKDAGDAVGDVTKDAGNAVGDAVEGVTDAAGDMVSGNKQ